MRQKPKPSCVNRSNRLTMQACCGISSQNKKALTMHSPPFNKTIGILAQSRERFQSIANILKEPCVWLTVPSADAPPIINMFVIDSDLLAADPARISRLRELYLQFSSRSKAVAHGTANSPISQEWAATLPYSEGMAYLQKCAHQQPILSHLKPGRVIIYQYSDHFDTDNSIKNT